LRAIESPEQADEDFAQALEAVTLAGRAALERFSSRNKSWRKADGTPVSEADLEVDEILRRILLREPCAYGWHSEESKASSPEARRFWLVDPIDGTSAFLGGSQAWCISLALIDGGTAVLGLIHAPAQKRLYSARAGRGAKLNDAPLKVSQRKELAGARMISNATALKDQRWRKPLPALERVSMPSLALRLAHVAKGEADAAIALSYKHDWDLAAGDLIVREAKGMASDLDGQMLRYDFGRSRRAGFLVANPWIHAALLEHGPIPLGQS
jgi:myo-inositol-1(or 4)-monophosphatase